MKITVTDDAGAVMYESDTKSMMGVAPALHEKAEVVKSFRAAADDLEAGRLRPIPDAVA